MHGETVALKPGEHICIVSTATVRKSNPVSVVHDKMVLIFVIDRETGQIVDFDVNTACDLTRRFLRQIMVGKNLISEVELIKESLLQNYMGDSVRSLIVGCKAARERALSCSRKEQDMEDVCTI